MIKLDKDKLEELKSICEDVCGVASLLNAVSDNDNDSVDITAVRIIGNLARDARDQLLMFIYDLQES